MRLHVFHELAGCVVLVSCGFMSDRLSYKVNLAGRAIIMLSTNQALVSVRGTRERMCVQVVPSLSSAHASRV